LGAAQRRLRLAFVSPVFLLPADAGGKIRTGNILRSMKGGAFEITLIAPATEAQRQRWQGELAAMCDHFVRWAPSPNLPRWRRAGDLLSSLPVNVAADRTPAALACVAETLAAGGFDAVVFDFVHAAVLMPAGPLPATVCFTHNVEAEIFKRHAETAKRPWTRWLWRSQWQKMARFEAEVLRRFTRVVAVSERDAAQFEKHYGLQTARTIPTGVDLDFFAWLPPQAPAASGPVVVFTGSMDWEANRDGIRFFIDEVWPLVRARQPLAQLRVVGRNPPAALVQRADPGVAFTGFVDDVRDHVRDAQAFVIPLRVGGGTRIKAFEAMAMGLPVVSTAIGIEGLAVNPGEHYLLADTAEALAAEVLRLIDDGALRERVSRAAREVVESQFGHRVAGARFEQICLEAVAAAAA
jgi:glycosyltransferase involved in cell wall biosynthesis